MSYIIIILSAVLVNNIVLMQFLGICPFLGVSKRISTAVGMAGAVAFVLVLATIVTYLIQYYVLNKLGLAYLQTIAFILVIAALVQLVEIILKKASPSLYQALGIFLPLITTNCAILGVAILTIQKEFNLLEGVVYAASNAVGFGLEYSGWIKRNTHCINHGRNSGNGFYGIFGTGLGNAGMRECRNAGMDESKRG